MNGESHRKLFFLMQVWSPGSCSGCPWLPCFTGTGTTPVLRPADKHGQVHTLQCSTVRCIDIGIDVTLTLQYSTVHYMDTDTDIGITVMLAA